MNRSKFVALLVVLICLLSGAVCFAATQQKVASPDGKLVMLLNTAPQGLTYELRFKGKPVIEPSAMGIVVDGANLAQGVQFGKRDSVGVNETYPTRGVHSIAVNNYNGARIAMRNKSGDAFTLEVRVFNDGAAFRYLVASSDKPRVPDEATTFRVPAGSTVWYHGLNGHYEGIHTKKAAAELQAEEWVAPPMTFQLPDNGGYASITEGALTDYAGMALQADGKLGFAARLGHAHPASHPYVLRYGAEEAKRLSTPAAITGAIQTPWRVIIVGADLNTLVNSDILTNVSPAPDPKYFPQGLATEWAKPGRAVWHYLDGGGERNFETEKDFSRMAGELGFEYNVVEGVWRRWSDAELRDFVDYSRKQNVQVIVWLFSKNLRNPEERRALFAKLHDAGVAGLKIDFFDHEAKEVVDLYEACLRDAAEYQLVINFHGANKPTGLQRTWPNELTREAVRGLEGSNIKVMGEHTTTLAFTRFLAGPADFTPTIFGDRRKETSWPNQIATAAVLTSPLLTYAANPKSLLENPAVDVIKSVPSTWDETIVLPVSRIGEIAAFARRSGDRWFLAIINGAEAKNIKVDLSFLGKEKYNATLVRDDMDNPASEKIEKITATKGDSLTINMRSGGGFIGSFSTK
jgi:alpha-glucosidase